MAWTGIERRLKVRRDGLERRVSPTYDMLQWIVNTMPGKYMSGTHSLYSVVWPDKYYLVKSPAGFPWDINLYDANFAYLWITEVQINGKWSPNSTDYKKTLANNTIPFCKRFMQSGEIVKAANTEIGQYQNCKQTATFSLGDTQCELHGPMLVSPGGDIPANSKALQIYYRWGGQGFTTGVFLTQETYTFVQPYGEIGWQTQPWNPATKAYDPPTSVSVFNQVKTGTVVPVFPCF